ncbi:MAG: Asp23/Gls24 family envelope stress response protein [Bacilli bacterium]|nr:Asp23/Gls24 family envelope stress response protein [Bacilli bacterium]
MAVKKISPLGGIDISVEAIASVAGSAAIECYGVVGLSAKNLDDDSNEAILGKKNFEQGIICEREKKGGYSISIYIVVASETKITEVIVEVQKKVKYVLEKTFGIKFKNVNVYVQGIKEL